MGIIKTLSDVNSILIIKSFRGLIEHHAEDSEVSVPGCNLALQHWWSRKAQITIAPNLAMLILMPLDDHVQELWRTAESLDDDLPHSSSVHCVECFCQINECTHLLWLPENNYHVGCAPVSSEATLTFWKVLFGRLFPVRENNSSVIEMVDICMWDWGCNFQCHLPLAVFGVGGGLQDF